MSNSTNPLATIVGEPRKCKTSTCTNTWPVTVPTARRLFCGKCRKNRAAKAVKDFRERKREHRGEDVAIPRAAGSKRREVLLWVCAQLANQGCPCGERRVTVLQFYAQNPQPDALSVADLVNRSVSLDRIQAAAKSCTVLCLNCYTHLASQKMKTYRYQYMADIRARRPPLIDVVRAKRQGPLSNVPVPPGTWQADPGRPLPPLPPPHIQAKLDANRAAREAEATRRANLTATRDAVASPVNPNLNPNPINHPPRTPIIAVAPGTQESALDTAGQSKIVSPSPPTLPTDDVNVDEPAVE